MEWLRNWFNSTLAHHACITISYLHQNWVTQNWSCLTTSHRCFKLGQLQNMWTVFMEGYIRKCICNVELKQCQVINGTHHLKMRPSIPGGSSVGPMSTHWNIIPNIYCKSNVNLNNKFDCKTMWTFSRFSFEFCKSYGCYGDRWKDGLVHSTDSNC